MITLLCVPYVLLMPSPAVKELFEELDGYGRFRISMARRYERTVWIIGTVVLFIAAGSISAVLLPRYIHPLLALALVALVGFVSIARSSADFEMYLLMTITIAIGGILVVQSTVWFALPGAASGLFLASLITGYFDGPNVTKARLEGVPSP